MTNHPSPGKRPNSVSSRAASSTIGASLARYGPAVQRIAIIGPPGSGKSTLAREFLAFLPYIWRWRRTRRPAVRERIARHGAGKQVHVLRSRRDLERFLALVSRA